MNDITRLKFSAQDYYRAALERKTEAYYLHESGRYALSIIDFFRYLISTTKKNLHKELRYRVLHGSKPLKNYYH